MSKHVEPRGDPMNVARAPKRRGTRAGADPVLERVPKKHDAGHPASIAELAYRLYEERGRQEGHQLKDWIEAERRLSDKQESGERRSSPEKNATAALDAPARVAPGESLPASGAGALDHRNGGAR